MVSDSASLVCLIFRRGKNRCCSRFVGWMDSSREMSVNARTSKEVSQRTEISVHFLRAVVDYVCVVGTERLVGFGTTINLQARP
ncbi:hypothetical protein AVEN_238158-1 [Araneus ventricosus]|uniref:Uncharacterized protein n=1 Tax=Araneus ventricosus TaxID=182803 RepID=A0A4Y2KKK7_ARAVE|nr:hypothetical protein AVEN_238158-1 [Araneus ventricosus]